MRAGDVGGGGHGRRKKHFFHPSTLTLLSQPPLPIGILHSPQFRSHQENEVTACRPQLSTSKSKGLWTIYKSSCRLDKQDTKGYYVIRVSKIAWLDGLEETGIQLVGFTDLVSVEICISLYSRHQIGPCEKRTGHDSMLNLAIQIDPKINQCVCI